MLRKAVIFAAAVGAILGLAQAPALAATSSLEPKDVHWSFEGPFGTFDTEQLQRGYKVYHDVCSACHAMSLLHYYNLGQPGGPFYDDKYPKPIDNPRVKALAAEVKVSESMSGTLKSAAIALIRGLSFGLGYLVSKNGPPGWPSE